MEDKNTNEDELPKLNITQENEFKKLKLSLQHDADFFGEPNLPAEIEGQFLDYVSSFENAFKNTTLITVYEKLGKPEYKPAATLSDSEITIALETVLKLMHTHNMALDVLCDYEDEDRLIYTFIVDELFLHEINDINISGMISHFTYEDFHQNHNYDLENATIDFLKMFLDKKSKLYKEYHRTDAHSHEDLNRFRILFNKFKIDFFAVTNLHFNDKEATVNFKIDFWGEIKGTESKTYYSGNGKITYEYKYGYWYVQVVELPIE